MKRIRLHVSLGSERNNKTTITKKRTAVSGSLQASHGDLTIVSPTIYVQTKHLISSIQRRGGLSGKGASYCGGLLQR